MLSHLAQRQSADNLDLNLRMIQIAQSNEIQINKDVEDKILQKTLDLEHSISSTLIQHCDLVRIHLKKLTDKITPYDVTDMERFISVQKKALNETCIARVQQRGATHVSLLYANKVPRIRKQTEGRE
jgi:hypothetical protein